MKTKIMKAICLCLALVLCFGSTISVSAAEVAGATIDETQKGSLTIFKYDLTNSENDGVWDSSYVSTGVADESGVNETMKNYALEGVEFSFVKVADIVQFTESTADTRTDSHVEVLYAIDKVQGADFLKALGLENGAQRYTNADALDADKYFYQTDVLIQALSTALIANSTMVKNAMEQYIAAVGGTAMPLTDSFGKTKAENLALGLYLIVETKVPENVVSTTDPFLISLPMTSVNGTNATDGGSRWIYDVTVYPKNQTGNPTLDKTVREAKDSTGKNTGSPTDITDGYAHTATASVGDTVDYQVISTLPTITSKASSLTEYTYVDTMSKGIRYNKNDVVIEFFKDTGCTDKITTWNESSGKFAVAYDDAQNIMTIKMTEAGLSEINEAATVYTDSVKRGYSDCTMRLTYAAALTADAKMGDTDNPNEVVLTWKRTNTTYFDTLKDCCHVYTYGIDVLKQFSDNGGNLRNVKFRLHNDTDDVFVIAEQKDGVYYAKGFAAKKADATTFVPNSSGHIVVKGLEDDAYSLTETATDKGYVLLKDAIKIVIKTSENGQCEKCGTKLLTASATVNGKDVTMSDGNAIVPLTVVNNPGFDLPKTGGYGTWMFTIGGVALLGAAAFIVIRSRKHKDEQ